jgi:hypothetical protein
MCSAATWASRPFSYEVRPGNPHAFLGCRHMQSCARAGFGRQRQELEHPVHTARKASVFGARVGRDIDRVHGADCSLGASSLRARAHANRMLQSLNRP